MIISQLKFVIALTASLLAFQTFAVEILGGSGHASEKLILDWAASKPNARENVVKFSDSILADDLVMLQKKKIDFAIVDSPLSEADLATMKLLQFPFTLGGISIVVNLPANLSGALKLDSQTVGKIFSGEITNWNDSAISSLNPKHELPNQEIVIVHSRTSSKDYPIFNAYIGTINEKWKAGDSKATGRVWPSNSVYKEGLADRYAAIKSTPYSIGYMPILSNIHPSLTPVQIKNKDGNFVRLSDTGILAAASKVNVENASADNLTLINKGGSASWPISNFSFILVNKDSVNEEKVVHFLNIISYGLKSGSLKPLLYDYVALPDQASRSIVARIESLTNLGNKKFVGVTSAPNEKADDTLEKLANKKRIDDEAASAKRSASPNDEDTAEKKLKQQAEARAAALELSRQNEARKAEELAKTKAAKLQAEAVAREEAIMAAKAAKIAADELLAKARKKEADDKQRELELRDQKDEDPLTAYKRSLGK
jgi:phosphate transport system substrate-binding protein